MIPGRILLCASALLAPLSAQARVAQVRLLNSGASGFMVFESAFVRIQPGDTVPFVPTDMGHDVETIPGMIPAGAQPLKGQPGKPYEVKFDKTRLYGLRCGPHYATGMVAVIVVGRGKPANLTAAQAVSQPGLSKSRMQTLLAQADAAPAAAKPVHKRRG